MLKKPYRVNGQDVVVKAENAVYDGNISTVDNAKDAIDNLNGRVSTLEQGGGGGSTPVTPSTSPFVGKEFALIGDSFSAGGKWFTVMCNALGATKGKNAAVSGGTWKLRRNGGKGASLQAVDIKEYYDQNGGAPDVILCVLGTNDASNMWGSGYKLGVFDYGDVRYRVRNTSTQEVTEEGYYIYGTNEVVLDSNGHTIFTKYYRNTTSRGGNGAIRKVSDISPTNYIFDGAESDSPSTPTANKLDTNFITGGMQATILYLRYYFPNADIIVGFTPAGLIHSGTIKGFVSGAIEDLTDGVYRTIDGVATKVTDRYNYEFIIERLQQVADLYGIRYINTLTCGISPWSEGTAKYIDGSHPSKVDNSDDDGQTAIGRAMAKIVMGL